MTTRGALNVLLLLTGESSDSRRPRGAQAPGARRRRAARAASASAWKQVAYVEALNPRAPAAQFWLCRRAEQRWRTLAVGSQMEESAATGDQRQPERSLHVQRRCGVAVYARTGDRWAQQAYVRRVEYGCGRSFRVCRRAERGRQYARRFRAVRRQRCHRHQRQPDRQLHGEFRRGVRLHAQRKRLVTTGVCQGVQHRRGGRRRSVRVLDRLERTATMLVVGAIGEDSDATGINGDQNNEGAQSAGARTRVHSQRPHLVTAGDTSKPRTRWRTSCSAIPWR